MKLKKTMVRTLQWGLVMVLLVSGRFGWVAGVQAQSLESELELGSQSALVVDSHNGQILYQRESQALHEVGGLTKLLVLYLVLDQVQQGQRQLDESVPISQRAYEVSQDYNIANVPLRQDYDYTVKELVDAVAIGQANGATIALSELLATSEGEVLDMMRQQLQAWGIEEADLVTVTGLGSDYQVQVPDTELKGQINQLSAQAVATITFHLLQVYPDLLEASKFHQKHFKPETEDAFQMTGFNLMLDQQAYEYQGTNGLMVGSSAREGASYVNTTERDHLSVISVVLANPQEDGHFQDTKKLLDYCFAAYQHQVLAQAGDRADAVGQLKTAGAKETYVPLSYQETLELVTPFLDTSPPLVYHFHGDPDYFNDRQELRAPQDAGTRVGTVTVELTGYDLAYLPSAPGNEVPVELAIGTGPSSWWRQAWHRGYELCQQLWQNIRHFFVKLYN